MSVLLDEENVVLDALDFDVPCSYPVAEMHAAEVVVMCRCCRNSAFCCSGHLQRDREKWSVSVALGGSPRCKQCKTTAETFDEVFEAVPL